MENNSLKQKTNVRMMFVTAGAYTSYTIGAGFASGNEVLQFFGSWGSPGFIVAVIFGFIFNAYFCASAYKAGQTQNFTKSRDVYAYFAGPYISWIFDVFVVIFVLGIFATMFSGAGSMLNQFFGLPQFVGAILIGALAIISVFGGLKAVEKILGYAGIVIIAFIIVLWIVSMVNPDSGFEQAAQVKEEVAKGNIWQAEFFGIKGLVFDGLIYAGVCLIVCVPFIASLGKGIKTSSEAVFSGIFSGIFFYIGVVFVVIMILTNFHSVVGADGAMLPIPALAVAQTLIGKGAIAYMIILCIGIYTTVTGYLWLLTDRVFGEKKENRNRKLVLSVLLVALGIALGSIIPFSALVNFLWPISGFVGLVLGVFMVIKDIRTKVAGSSGKAA